jgi:hypothetical protein
VRDGDSVMQTKEHHPCPMPALRGCPSALVWRALCATVETQNADSALLCRARQIWSRAARTTVTTRPRGSTDRVSNRTP